MNKVSDLLFDIHTNNLVQNRPIIPKKLTVRHENGTDYIYIDGTIKKSNTGFFADKEHTDVSALIGFLDIGYFIHEVMVKDYQLLDVYYKDNRLKNNELYPRLENKVLKFCYKFGIEVDTKSIDALGRLIPRVQLYNYLYQSSKLYLWYRDFTKNTQHLEFMKQFESILSLELRAQVYVEPIFAKNGEIDLRYTFDSVFDLANYQFLFFLRGTQDYKIGLCPYCNTFFRKKVGKQLYCSTSHGDYDRLRKNITNNDHPHVQYQSEKICKLESCRKIFTPTHQKQEYCPGGKCKKRAEYLATKKKKLIQE